GRRVQEPERPPVAAVCPLLLHAHVAAADRAELVREPLAGAALATRRRAALVRGQLADHPLYDVTAWHERREATWTRTPRPRRSARASWDGSQTGPGTNRADPGRPRSESRCGAGSR